MKDDFKLQFVHIRKTGGTSIEHFGYDNSILWSWKNPKLFSDVKKKYTTVPWHTPPKYFLPNPYKGYKTFSVVRNPYTRVISAYYCPWDGNKHHIESKEVFNKWIQNVLRNRTSLMYILAPQVEYLPIDHIIRFENLEEEFKQLMNDYGIHCENLPHSNQSKWKGERFTIDDMYPDTIKLINDTFREDFSTLNYKMIKPI